ncbi:ANTAR domain-containing protein [Cellulomonas endophytica]|uniref:ANTAR domain-containing protein n=1 Tax=Cellulomonas endophytica TaxID=2494735 RepID=UPI001011E875|nr:ANTAR domain-containing protein [Cellulomonas endophytica]
MPQDGAPGPRTLRQGPPPGSRSWLSADLHALDDLLGRARDAGAATAPAAGAPPAPDPGHGSSGPFAGATDDPGGGVAALLAERRVALLQRQWLAGALPVPMLLTEVSGTVLSANAAASRGLGISTAHLLRKDLLGFVDPADRDAVRALAAAAGPEPSHVRVRLVPRRGPSVVADLVVTAGGWTDGTGELAWTFVVVGAGPPGPTAEGADGAPAAEATGGATGEGAGGSVVDTAGVRVATAFARILWLPAETSELQVLLQRTAAVVAAAVPAADAVSVNLGSAAAPTAMAATGTLASAGDGLQVRVGEGPCVTASEAQETALSPDVRADGRWPRLARAADGGEVAALVAAPVVGEQGLVGAVNLYARGVDAFSPDDVEAAEVLATAAGGVLAEHEQRERLRELAAQLHQGLASRATIDVAKGIVLAQRGGTPDEAFAFLSRVSQQRNVKLRVLARSLVDGLADRRPSGPDGRPGTAGRG